MACIQCAPSLQLHSLNQLHILLHCGADLHADWLVSPFIHLQPNRNAAHLLWLCSVTLHSHYRPAPQAPPLPLHLHWFRSRRFTQPACFLQANALSKRKWHHSTQTGHKHTETRWGPNVFQVSFDFGRRDTAQPLRQKPAGRETASGRHSEECQPDTTRLPESLHVQVELQLFSQTLWWVVSSYRQRVCVCVCVGGWYSLLYHVI